MSKWSDEEKHDADLLAEEFTGKPVNYGSTEKAIARLEQRLALLNNRVAQAVADPAALRAEIRQTETDLAAYRRLHENRN